MFYPAQEKRARKRNYASQYIAVIIEMSKEHGVGVRIMCGDGV